jgi:hypothetical protein
MPDLKICEECWHGSHCHGAFATSGQEHCACPCFRLGALAQMRFRTSAEWEEFERNTADIRAQMKALEKK